MSMVSNTDEIDMRLAAEFLGLVIAFLTSNMKSKVLRFLRLDWDL